VRFAASNVGPATCTAWYNPMSGSISLLNDAGTTWTAGTMGSGALANSQCTLNLASSSAITNGHDVIVTLNITFTASFHGLKKIYMQAADSGTSSGWIQRGTWTVPVAVVNAVSATPNFGAGTRQVFTLAYADTLGVGDLAFVRVRFSSSNVGPGTCTVSYSPMTGVVQLLGDNGSSWTAGTMGNGTLANSQCTLNLGSSSATPSPSTLTLVLDITFDASFAGQKNIYMLAASSEGPNTGWQQRGTWTVMIPTTIPISAAPQFGAATTQTFTLTYFDSLGGFDLSSARVRFAASNVGPGTCTARYNTGAGTIELLDDAGASWQSATLGSGTLANSQCTLNLAGSTASVDGDNVTLALNITFAPGFIGLKKIYMLAANSSGLSSGWFVKGTWTPNPDPASHAPIDLGTLGGTDSKAYVVNVSGQVAGTGDVAGNITNHAFSWTQAAGKVDLGTLGGAYSFADGLNDAGQIVGYSATANGFDHGFSWTQAGGMVDVGTLGGSYSYALYVNANGQVVGDSWAGTLMNSFQHAFLWTQAGGMVDLGALGDSYSSAHGVNDLGQVVGESNSHPFSWTQAGGMVDLGGTDGYASAVNNSGQVVGYRYFPGSGNHAFSWTQAGGMVDLGTLGGPESAATDVNDSGQVVGFIGYSSIEGPSHAFSWTQAGGMVDLGTLGGDFSSAYSVSANGQVVGVSTLADGSYHAFSWTQAGGMLDLGSLGGSTSVAYAVNDHCQVVGYSTITGDAQTHATLWNVGPCAASHLPDGSTAPTPPARR
jgi:probable HAF family extracellular repeat protein